MPSTLGADLSQTPPLAGAIFPFYPLGVESAAFGSSPLLLGLSATNCLLCHGPPRLFLAEERQAAAYSEPVH